MGSRRSEQEPVAALVVICLFPSTSDDLVEGIRRVLGAVALSTTTQTVWRGECTIVLQWGRTPHIVDTLELYVGGREFTSRLQAALQ